MKKRLLFLFILKILIFFGQSTTYSIDEQYKFIPAPEINSAITDTIHHSLSVAPEWTNKPVPKLKDVSTDVEKIVNNLNENLNSKNNSTLLKDKNNLSEGEKELLESMGEAKTSPTSEVPSREINNFPIHDISNTNQGNSANLETAKLENINVYLILLIPFGLIVLFLFLFFRMGTLEKSVQVFLNSHNQYSKLTDSKTEVFSIIVKERHLTSLRLNNSKYYNNLKSDIMISYVFQDFTLLIMILLMMESKSHRKAFKLETFRYYNEISQLLLAKGYRNESFHDEKSIHNFIKNFHLLFKIFIPQ